MAPERLAEGLEGLKYNHKEYEHQCLLLAFKVWGQRTAQAVDVSWEGTISHKSKLYLATTLPDHRHIGQIYMHTL